MTNSSGNTGYKRPPKSRQFQPGQSGNPAGRPKGAKNLATLIAEEGRQRVTIQEGGKTRRVSKHEAIIKRLHNQALNGDMKAIRSLLAYMAMIDMNPTTEKVRPLSESDQAIIARYLATQQQQPGKEIENDADQSSN